MWITKPASVLCVLCTCFMRERRVRCQRVFARLVYRDVPGLSCYTRCYIHQACIGTHTCLHNTLIQPTHYLCLKLHFCGLDTIGVIFIIIIIIINYHHYYYYYHQFCTIPNVIVIKAFYSYLCISTPLSTRYLIKKIIFLFSRQNDGKLDCCKSKQLDII